MPSGENFAEVIRGNRKLEDNHALITCPSPFGQWPRAQGGREYRGIRTRRYTYTRSLEGPWELFDNQEDPFQQHNLIKTATHRALRDELEDKLKARLLATGDDFASGDELIKRCGYRVDARGTHVGARLQHTAHHRESRRHDLYPRELYRERIHCRCHCH